MLNNNQLMIIIEADRILVTSNFFMISLLSPRINTKKNQTMFRIDCFDKINNAELYVKEKDYKFYNFYGLFRESGLQIT
jgi:hypothetical protein